MYWEGGLVWGELRKAIQSFRLRLHSDLPPQRTSSPGTPGLRQRGSAFGAIFAARLKPCPSDSPWSVQWSRAEHGAPGEWAGVSDAREPDAAGTNAEGFGGAVGSAGADPAHRDEVAMNGALRVVDGSRARAPIRK